MASSSSIGPSTTSRTGATQRAGMCITIGRERLDGMNGLLVYHLMSRPILGSLRMAWRGGGQEVASVWWSFLVMSLSTACLSLRT